MPVLEERLFLPPTRSPPRESRVGRAPPGAKSTPRQDSCPCRIPHPSNQGRFLCTEPELLPTCWGVKLNYVGLKTKSPPSWVT